MKATHIRRDEVPWRAPESTAECGKAIVDQPWIDRDQYGELLSERYRTFQAEVLPTDPNAKFDRKHLGVCGSCIESAAKWANWMDDPIALMIRYVVGVDRSWTRNESWRSAAAELRALGELVEIHREQFERIRDRHDAALFHRFGLTTRRRSVGS